MNANSIHWMNYSVEISARATQSNLCVGAVLVSDHNELMCSAFEGEERNKSCSSILLSKVRKLKISKVQNIYITLNRLSSDNSFDLIELLKEINFSEIYFGLPDPSLSFYLVDDPAITLNHIYRYPDELQRKILEINSHFFADSKQSIKYSPYYSKTRISNLVIDNLKAKGFVVSKNELNVNKRMPALQYLRQNGGKSNVN